MAVFYKIDKDGESVLVTKSFSNSIQKTANNKWKQISVTKFLAKIPASHKELMAKEIERVKEINDMRLFSINSISVKDLMSESIRVTYNIDGQLFREDYGELQQYHELKDAQKYCKDKYGKDFAMQYGYIFENNYDNDDNKCYYFKNNRFVNEDEYFSLKKEYDELTQTKNLKHKLGETKINKR